MQEQTQKLNFDNLYVVSHQPGALGDSLVAFLSLHQKQASFKIIGNRMRTATPGILLNWAAYYKNWPDQVANPNLYKQIDLRPGVSNFVQAHFFLKEDQILNKFPGSRAIRLLVDRDDNMEIYFKYLYHKLLNKRMHKAWYGRYLSFARLRDKHTQNTLLNMCNDRTLRIKHYWTAWYVDNLGMDMNLVPNPMEYWLTRKYITDFHPNLNTMLVDNKTAIERSGQQGVIDLYIDRIWPIGGSSMDRVEYERLCELTGLVPDYSLAQKFWDWRESTQPNPNDITVSKDWI